MHKMAKKKNVKKNSFISYEFNNPFEFSTELALERSDISETWPKSTIREINKIKKEEAPDSSVSRVDLTNKSFVTIDGKSAKDFDDALYAEETPSGFKLFVSIADVSEYVKKNSALDIEALNRGTSIYFRNKVIPMLPELLSNGKCSLNPNEKKYTISCVIDLTRDAEIMNYDFCESVIKSKARLTYESLGPLFSKPKNKLDKKINTSLNNLEKIYRALKQKRQQRNSIEFNLSETKPISNKSNRILKFTKLKRNEYHGVVEECMILANICAANFLLKRKIPTIFRFHEKPDLSKITNLKEFLTSRGFKKNMKTSNFRNAILSWLEESKKTRFEEIINIQILRSMKLAKYDSANSDHFALALDKYCHFTSPIRRYADLVVHRGIKGYLREHNKNNGSSFFYNKNEVAEISELISDKERKTEKITKEAEKFLKCKCAENYIGEEFDGTIVSVFDFGFFVKIHKLNIDGFCHINSFKGGKRIRYKLDETIQALKGKKENYFVGDSIKVKITSVDIFRKRIDLKKC